MATIVSAKGIVLSKRRYKEHDYLVKLLLEDYGKLMFYVKGSKKPNQRLNSLIQPFTKAQFIVQLNSKGLSFIKDGKDSDPFMNIQQDIFKQAYATYICALIDVCMEDKIPSNPLFRQLVYALEHINQQLDGQVIMNIFEIKLLHYFGVMPELRGCVVCCKREGSFDYSSIYHGLLCSDHYNRDDHRLRADPKTMHIIRQFLTLDLKNVQCINISDATKNDIQRVIDTIYDELVGVRLKSKKFIQQMHEWAPFLEDND